LRREAEIRGDFELYGYREYLPDGRRGTHWVWSTRSQILERVQNFANGLKYIGLKSGETFGILTTPREVFCSYFSLRIIFSRNFAFRVMRVDTKSILLCV
jgi:hypothetical protein